MFDSLEQKLRGIQMFIPSYVFSKYSLMLVGLVEDPLHKLGCCTISAACSGKSSAVLVYCDKMHVP